MASLTIYEFQMYLDEQNGARFLRNLPVDETLLQCKYFLFRINLLHELTLLNFPEETNIPIDVGLDHWLMIPCHELARTSTTRRMLSAVGVSDASAVDYIARGISFTASQILAQNPSISGSRNTIPVSVDIHAVTPYDLRIDDHEIEHTMRESAEQVRITNIPASTASIEALKEVKKIEINYDPSAKTTDQEFCMICLEELYSTSHEVELDDHDDRNRIKKVVTSLPCSHLFHKECILQWLKASHFCPLCRYAMPTSS